MYALQKQTTTVVDLLHSLRQAMHAADMCAIAKTNNLIIWLMDACSHRQCMSRQFATIYVTIQDIQPMHMCSEANHPCSQCMCVVQSPITMSMAWLCQVFLCLDLMLHAKSCIEYSHAKLIYLLPVSHASMD